MVRRRVQLVRHEGRPVPAGRAPRLHRAGPAHRRGHRAPDRGRDRAHRPGRLLHRRDGQRAARAPRARHAHPARRLRRHRPAAADHRAGDPGRSAAAGRHLRGGAQHRSRGDRRRPRHGHAGAGGALQGRAAERGAAHPRRPAHRHVAGDRHRHDRRLHRPQRPRALPDRRPRRNDYTEMAAGAVLVAALALIVEALLGALQRLLVSPGLRTAQASRRAPRQAPVVAGGIAS